MRISSGNPRLVVVHERFTELGGSEQVARHLAGLSLNSRVFAPIIDRDRLPAELVDHPLSSSFLQPFYQRPGLYAHLLPLLPMAMASADLSDADLVITSHHAFANRVNVRPAVPLISYTHSPARWMWDRQKLDGESGGRLGAAALRTYAALLRSSDREAGRRVDVVVANSRTVARRIRRWWGRDSVVIHPPVNVDYYTPAEVERDRTFLVAGRQVPYKRLDVAVRAATRTGHQLLVAGGGRALPAAKAIAGPNVRFLGPVSDQQLQQLYRQCTALLFPGEEDFGMVPVEAQACGAPVIARAVGGATETVVDGVTGRLIEADEADLESAFCQAMTEHDHDNYDRSATRANAERFSSQRFVEAFSQLLASHIDGWPSGSSAAALKVTR